MLRPTRILTFLDQNLSSARRFMGSNLPLYVFVTCYAITVLIGNLLYLTESGVAGARRFVPEFSTDRFHYFGTAGFWLLLILPLVIVPAASWASRSFVGKLLPRNPTEQGSFEFNIFFYSALSVALHIYCIWVIQTNSIFDLSATSTDAISSVQNRFIILERVGFPFRVAINSILPFLVIYAFLRAQREGKAYWWTAYVGNFVLNSVYLISLNMKWPILVFWLVNLIAIFYFTQRYLVIKLVVASIAYVISYLAISAFVLRVPIPVEFTSTPPALITQVASITDVPAKGELQLAGKPFLFGAIVAGVRLDVHRNHTLLTTIQSPDHQAGSVLIRSEPGAAYAVRYAVEVTSGAMGIGVLDADHDSWLATTLIDDEEGTLPFVATSSQFRVILFNTASPTSSMATITALSVGRVPVTAIAALRPPAEVEVPKVKLIDVPDDGELDLKRDRSVFRPVLPGVRFEADADRVKLTTMPSAEYQAGSASFRAEPGMGYAIRYDIEVTSGDMEIGVLDTANNQWIDIKPIKEARGILAFTVKSDRFRIILFNTSDPRPVSSTATLIKLSLSRVDPSVVVDVRSAASPDGRGEKTRPDARAGTAEPRVPGASGAKGAASVGARKPDDQEDLSAGGTVAVLLGAAGGIPDAIASGFALAGHLFSQLLNRMAVAYPFYYEEFTEKGWVCGTLWDRVLRKPSPCAPSIHIYNTMYQNDQIFRNRGTATAAVNISAYAVGGWPSAIIATMCAGLLLGVFAAVGAVQSSSALHGAIWVMGAQVAYFLTQLPFEAAIVYDHGAVWWGALFLAFAGVTYGGRMAIAGEPAEIAPRTVWLARRAVGAALVAIVLSTIAAVAAIVPGVADYLRPNDSIARMQRLESLINSIKAAQENSADRQQVAALNKAIASMQEKLAERQHLEALVQEVSSLKRQVEALRKTAPAATGPSQSSNPRRR